MNISQNIKGRVIALNWHPEKEQCLLFGTSHGQIGLADVINGRISQFSHFHQKPAYKVN